MNDSIPISTQWLLEASEEPNRKAGTNKVVGVVAAKHAPITPFTVSIERARK